MFVSYRPSVESLALRVFTKMSQHSEDEIASILEAARTGDPRATQRLFSLVYGELKKIARNRLSSGSHWTTETTTLVHETYLRMIRREDAAWSDKHHFFWAAARAMRDILVERARRDAATKRGGRSRRVELNDSLLWESAPPDLLDLSEALEKLTVAHPESAKVVELRFFAGLGLDEISEMMGLDRSKAWREWDFARAWLSRELSDSAENNVEIEE